MCRALSAGEAAVLERMLETVERVFLARARPATGLLPASTARNEHGDYTHAWVRDGVFSAVAPWALAEACARHAGFEHRAEPLRAAVTRLMRGLLDATRGQAAKVESFKHSRSPADALHAKYDADTGRPVAADDAWGHLQLDATGLYLLILAQMSAGGLAILRDGADAAFVQELVWYVGAASRTPDFGMWERGDKTNTGLPERNASSVGLCKAALEALDGFVFTTADGARAAPIAVHADDVRRCRLALESLLPAESRSKETDSALWACVGWPAWAVDDPDLAAATRARLAERLEGRYGCKRFLLDGHQTGAETPARLHYEPGELGLFRHLEPEWPLFFAFRLLDAALRGDAAETDAVAAKLDPLYVEAEGLRLLPEVYFVPVERHAAEREAPGSQPREANANLPLLWAQSLALAGDLVRKGLLEPRALDPLGRAHRRVEAEPVRVRLVAEDAEAVARAVRLGLRAAPLPAGCVLVPPAELEDAFAARGRPDEPGGPAAAWRVYAAGSTTVLAAAPALEGAPEAAARRLRADLRDAARTGGATATLRLTAARLKGSHGRALAAVLRDLSGEGLIRFDDDPPTGATPWPGPAPRGVFAADEAARVEATRLAEARAELAAAGVDAADGPPALIEAAALRLRADARALHGLPRLPADLGPGASAAEIDALLDAPGIDAACAAPPADPRAWRRRFGRMARLTEAEAARVHRLFVLGTTVEAGAGRLDAAVLAADVTAFEPGLALRVVEAVGGSPLDRALRLEALLAAAEAPEPPPVLDLAALLAAARPRWAFARRLADLPPAEVRRRVRAATR